MRLMRFALLFKLPPPSSFLLETSSQLLYLITPKSHIHTSHTCIPLCTHIQQPFTSQATFGQPLVFKYTQKNKHNIVDTEAFILTTVQKITIRQ